MNIKQVALLLLVCMTFSTLRAQQTTVFTDANLAFKRGLDFYEQGVLAKAKREFQTKILLTFHSPYLNFPTIRHLSLSDH